MSDQHRQPQKPYTPQKLSRWADLKVQYRLFRMYLKKKLAIQSRVRTPWIAGALILAVLVVVILPGPFHESQVARFVEKAEAAQLALEAQKQTDIYHRVVRVSEREGKAAYVAKVKGVPLEDAELVALRHDTVEQWEHDITSLSHIETDVFDRPLVVKLNLENEDHMHIFEYSPESCDVQSTDDVKTKSCSEGMVAQASETYIAHRNVFDEVHDISSVYAPSTTYEPEPKLLDIRSLTFSEFLEDEDGSFVVFMAQDGTVEQRYFFDRKSFLLKKQVTSIIEDGERFVMSEIFEMEHSFISAEEAPSIFDPTGYAYEQLEVFPLSG